ncbi:protein-tyrosine phosphatase family protein [Paludisphaera mucosa]|uniref:Tyrosine specific protein phosphatases domain-containing protein n=1 Tax=Paludisphaera mucosa TaxID=3030827 RepID=A0ABT6F7D7_9BACT|nr:hypothetical protein [Paludisphaera mucosa]MDG3003474.1 hypothetical protein [Paludisphaera mucosa]
MVRRRPVLWILGVSGLLIVGLAASLAVARDRWMEKRVQVVYPGRLVRGAWQQPMPLRRIVAREGIKTIVTLTAINSTDQKFVSQSQVVRDQGLDWVIVPMRGSRATVEQMAIAADLLADPTRQPVFFHCVAGHHRTSLAHAAYLIRHEGYSARQAWETISAYSWARPDALVDRNDQFLIEEFARVQETLAPEPGSGYWEVGSGKHAQTARSQDPGDARLAAPGPDGLDRLEPGARQLRDRAAGPDLPIGADVADASGQGPS